MTGKTALRRLVEAFNTIGTKYLGTIWTHFGIFDPSLAYTAEQIYFL
jgi:hypothetical protein